MLEPPRALSRLTRFYPEIEGFRGILSMIVLFTHVFGALTPEKPFFWAWGSMEVFFCISGFVIARNFFIKYGERVSAAYFVNRALRIWPMYYVAWAFAAATTFIVGSGLVNGNAIELNAPSGPGAWLPAFFLQNVESYYSSNFTATSLALFSHSWSVALEEQFYFILAPLAFIFFRKRSLAFIVAMTVALVGCSAVARSCAPSPLILIARLEGFTLGILLAFIEVRSLVVHEKLAAFIHERRVYLVLLICSSVSIALYFAEHFSWAGLSHLTYLMYLRPFINPNLGFALLAFGLLGITTTVGLPRTISHALRFEALQQLGRISYSTYLLHVPIVFSLCPAALRALGLDSRWSVLISPALVIPLSFITYHGIEMPFLKMKAYRSRSGPPALA